MVAATEETAKNKATLNKDELEHKIEIATQTLDRNISFVANCDNKTSIVLASFGVLLAIILTNEGLNEILNIVKTCIATKTFCNILYLLCLAGATFVMVFGLFNLGSVLAANTTEEAIGKKDESSHIFFAGIRKNGDYETYNQKFAPNRTVSDWLCADEGELDAYLADPLCRESISAGLFYQLLGSMKRTGSSSAYENWDKNLPVLLLSGQDDPVGDGGKGVKKVYASMQKAGLKQVSMHLFTGARHDLLHEESNGCAEQARKILLNWIMKSMM
jgi:hypothetical protein